LGGYIGGVSSNDLELNPVQWNWRDPSTYFSIAIGAAAGALGGYGLVYPGTVLYDFSLITPFVDLGVSGFQNDWNFRWTTIAGGSGEIPLNDEGPVYSAEHQVGKGISDMYRHSDPRFYHGSLNEAKDLLVATSKYHNAEMGMYYLKDYGYYFEDRYGYLAKSFYANAPSGDFWSYSHFDGYNKYYYGENQIDQTWTYSLHPKRNELYIPNGLHPRQNVGRPDAYFHTHPSSGYLSFGDQEWSKNRGIPMWAVGWDGTIRGVFSFFLPELIFKR
jgi:hypothetical protein